MKRLFKNGTLLLILIILIGAFLRFYKLDWGNGIFAHPDEYHIVASVEQLSFPSQMHPNFFNYGTFTIYLIYFTKQITIAFFQLPDLNAFLIGRLYSALFSTLTLIFIYKIAQIFMSKRFALIATFFAAITPGLIQQAHFATPESNLIFLLFGSLLFLLHFLNSGKIFHIVLSSIFLGLALGVKVSGAVFFAPLFIGILLKFRSKILTALKLVFLSASIIIITFAAVAPFDFLDYPAFLDSFRYESSLAEGSIPVFYTRQFFDTTPFLFQMEKIFPFALGPAILVLGFSGLAALIFSLFKKHQFSLNHLILLISFLALFIPNTLLFAKWTRFLAPTFPFFALFAAFLLEKITWPKNNKKLLPLVNAIFLVLAVFWTTAFFAIYTHDDVRTTASQWFVKNIRPGSTFMLEGANMVDVPLFGNFPKRSFDFYNLEEDAKSRQLIAEALVKADYFVIQSRRVFINHQRLPQIFPKTVRFYDHLFAGDLGFEEVQKFTSFPRVSLLGLNIEFPDETLAEETWSVFDHPVIRVFKKTKILAKEDYTNAFEN